MISRRVLLALFVVMFAGAAVAHKCGDRIDYLDYTDKKMKAKVKAIVLDCLSKRQQLDMHLPLPFKRANVSSKFLPTFCGCMFGTKYVPVCEFGGDYCTCVPDSPCGFE